MFRRNSCSKRCAWPHPQAEKAIMTIEQQLIAQGITKGRAEGIATGRAEGIATGIAKGRAEGRRTLLLRQLTVKFGRVPATTQRRIARAVDSEIERWAERILTAKTLREVFDDKA